MADADDYLSVYKKFFEDFAATVNPDDQLPVRVAGYCLREDEIVGEIVDWTLQYINQKNCPAGLTAPIARQVLDEVKAANKKDPESCGFVHSKHAYDPLRLMHAVVRVVNEVCGRYRDNGRVLQLPRPRPGPPISTCAIRNSRRVMEDRHVIVHDLHAVYGIPDPSPASYYAVFDGHAGTDAAIYGVSHLHQFLVESPFYPKDPVRALKDAFRRTDQLFIEKSHIENLRSGTTVVCALIRPEEKKLYVAWLGDSQALLVRRERMVLLVNPHKPDRPDERERIEKMGGCVMYFGTWRVNGQLAVSRAIGDSEYKPYVCAEPDVTELSLDGSEDFLVLACDGLWDFVTEQQVAAAVYLHLHEHPDDVSGLSEQLVCLSKEQGSTDNISVIVALLRPARDMDMGGGALLHPPESLRGHERRDQHQQQHLREHEHDQDDDLGPETSVDDGELQRQQLADLDPAAEPRQEAPTPPAASLLPGQCEPDNVADSGEDSEDEWNYYKIEPAEKAVNVECLVQTKQPVCPESTQLNLEEKPEDIFDMESRLNPDAKEFVPSPTHSKPSFEDTIISHSPVGKILPFDNVEVPSMAQFQQEISQRPGEVSQEDALSNSGYLPDIRSDILNGGSIMEDVIEKKYGDLELKLTEQNVAAFTSNNPFEVSEVSSTKAVYGDESAASFTTSTSDILQKNLGTSVSNVEGSFMETDFVGSETSGTKQSDDFLGFEGSNEFTEFKKGLDKSLTTEISPTKETGTISFELQKDIAPTMEECPERVKLTDDLINPFSHEQPIAEMPMEECEQLSENERTDLLNESFEHGPDFTLEAYEVSSSLNPRSPLNPCAPSFDYKNLEDGTDVPKVGETNENAEALEQKHTDVSSDFVSNVPISQSLSPESPVEQLDMAKTELTELNRDILTSDHEKPSFEVGNEIGKVGSFEQVEEYLNKSNLSEKSDKDLISPSSDAMLNFDLPSVEAVEKSISVEESPKLERKFENKSSEVVDKEFMDELHETSLDLGNEFDNRTTEHIEQFDPESEVSQSSDQKPTEQQLGKDVAEPMEQQVGKDNAEPPKFGDEMEEQQQLGKDVAEPMEQQVGKDNAKPPKFGDEMEEQQQQLGKDVAEPMEQQVGKDNAEPPKFGDEMEEQQQLGKDVVELLEQQVGKDNAEPPKFGDEMEEQQQLGKDVVELMEQQVGKDNAEPPKFADEMCRDNIELLDQLHREANGLRDDVKESGEDIRVSEETKTRYLETITGINDYYDIQTTSLPSDPVKPDASVESPELNNEIHIKQSMTLENRLTFEAASLPAEIAQSQEAAPLAEQIMDDIISAPDLHSVPEALRICVYPMPVEQNNVKDDVELLSPSFESREEKREPLEEKHILGADFAMGVKLESLPGEQRDMVETMLNEVSHKTELVGLTSKSDVFPILQDVETEITEKTEETTEKLVEKKDISNVEQTEKLKAIDIKPETDETLKLSDTDFCGAVVEKGDSDKKVHKAGEEEEVPILTKTPPPTPTPASQVELTVNKDVSEGKPEQTAATVAVAAAAAVAGITATTANITTRKEPTLKKQATPATKDVKKTPVTKDSDKIKPATKAPIKQSPGTAKVPTKTSPTSPTKLSVTATPRTSTPKRTQVAPPAAVPKTTAKTTTTIPAKPLSRPTSTAANKPNSLATQRQSPTTTGKVPTSSTTPKPGLKAPLSSTTKPAQTVRAASAPKPRVSSATTATATKNTVANGDLKSTEVKKSSVATSKAAPRLHTASSRTQTITKTAGTTGAASIPKTGVQARTALTSRSGMTNGITQKPRVTSSTGPSARPATNHQTATDKQHKETANKHISSRRIGTAPAKTSPAKVGVKKSPPTAKVGKMAPATNGSPLISTGAGDVEKKDPLL